MLYLFDMDGTLITNYMENPGREYGVWEVLPRRKAKLDELRMRGDAICIVTNQRGVAFGYVAEADADAKIDDVARRLGFYSPRSSGDPPPRTVFACYYHEQGQGEWADPVLAAQAKPSPAMLIEAMRAHPEQAARGVLMVGDRDEDYEAARAAGVPFQWAHIFFGV